MYIKVDNDSIISQIESMDLSKIENDLERTIIKSMLRTAKLARSNCFMYSALDAQEFIMLFKEK